MYQGGKAGELINRRMFFECTLKRTFGHSLFIVVPDAKSRARVYVVKATVNV